MKIAVINTGGTISCIGQPLSPMTAQQFADACTQLINSIIKNQFVDIELDYVVDLKFPESSAGTLDSTNLQPSDWTLMAGCILDHYTEYDGWVILHGTDSMDFTAGALPFLLNVVDENGIGTAVLSKPVIVTGSQVPLFHQISPSAPLSLNFNTDAFQNFCGSVACARTGIPEVGVYFQNHLYRGNRVLKTNASHFDAFSSPNYPPLAESGTELVLRDRALLPGPVSNGVSLDCATVLKLATDQLRSIQASIDQVPVIRFSSFPASYSPAKGTATIANLLAACAAQGIAGLVLESYGEGNFPSGNPDHPEQGAIYQGLEKIDEDDVVIVDCTQVIAGTVNNNAYASGAWLPAVGALSPADITPMAALGKLTLLLASQSHHGWSLNTVKKLLQTDLHGEMLAINFIDSRLDATLNPGQQIRTLDGSAALVNDQHAGPILLDQKNAMTPIWTAMTIPPKDQMPGRLEMQNDGNLVFYGRYNTALWSTNTGVAGSASSRLLVHGSVADANLRMTVYDYTRKTTTATLYPPLK